MALGLILTIVISNFGSFMRDGQELEKLRSSVLRLHILANSDSDYDQQLKLMVRDALLEHSDEIFGKADSREEAEKLAEENFPLIEQIARETLEANGCSDDVTAELEETYFDERVYGDITMPAGNYMALRVKIGNAQGHNWWCVMYPTLCVPAAYGGDTDLDDDAVSSFFDEKQQDIIYNPQKYRVRFAIWDKIKSWVE